MNISHLKITQAGLVAAVTSVVGTVVAVVPQWAPEKADLIQGGSYLIAGAFMLANAIHKLADSNVSASDVQADAEQFARTEAHAVLDKVDFQGLVESVVDAKDPVAAAESAARDEVQKILGGLGGLLGGGAAVPPVPEHAHGTAETPQPSAIPEAAPVPAPPAPLKQ